MENQAEQKEKGADKVLKPLIWDCGSSLYDSFELESFERKLHSAINSRTLSMPHLSDRRELHGGSPSTSQLPDYKPTSKKSSFKFSGSVFHKLLRFVLKPKQNGSSNGSLLQVQEKSKDGCYVRGHQYDGSSTSGVLSTIPEAPEMDGFSLSTGSLVLSRSASDRFTAASISFSCT